MVLFCILELLVFVERLYSKSAILKIRICNLYVLSFKLTSISLICLLLYMCIDKNIFRNFSKMGNETMHSIVIFIKRQKLIMKGDGIYDKR